MYSDEQKREHIKEMQRFLYNISFYNSRIPVIIPDGIYGPQTSGAVRMFQQEYGLTPTGNADRATFDKAAELERILYMDIKSPQAFKSDTLLIPGSAGPVMYILQVMLNTIGSKYMNMPVIGLTGIYDESTENSVKRFRELSGNTDGGEGVDADMWNCIVTRFNADIR